MIFNAIFDLINGSAIENRYVLETDTYKYCKDAVVIHYFKNCRGPVRGCAGLGGISWSFYFDVKLT